MKGLKVCRMHGGSTKRAKTMIKRTVNEQMAASAAARFALPVTIGPAEGLLAEVHRTAGMIAWLEAQLIRVTGQHPDRLIYGLRSTKTVFGGEFELTTTDEGPGVHDWLSQWQKERVHFVNVCRATLKAGIEQRQIEATEFMAVQIVQVLKGIFADLDLTAAQQALVPVVVPKHLSAVREPA